MATTMTAERTARIDEKVNEKGADVCVCVCEPRPPAWRFLLELLCPPLLFPRVHS